MENLIPMKTTQSKWAGLSKVFKVGGYLCVLLINVKKPVKVGGSRPLIAGGI